jgi:hypothetical protein
VTIRAKERKIPRRKTAHSPSEMTRSAHESSAARELDALALTSRATFRRELPELLSLRSPRRQWVAYHGSCRLGFAATKHELYQKYVRRGIERGDLYVRNIAPEAQAAEVLFEV